MDLKNLQALYTTEEHLVSMDLVFRSLIPMEATQNYLLLQIFGISIRLRDILVLMYLDANH